MKPLLALWIMLTFGTMTLLLAFPPPVLQGTEEVVSSRSYGWPRGWLTREEGNSIPYGRGAPGNVHTVRWYICKWDSLAIAATVSVLGPGLLVMPILLATRKREGILADQQES